MHKHRRSDQPHSCLLRVLPSLRAPHAFCLRMAFGFGRLLCIHWGTGMGGRTACCLGCWGMHGFGMGATYVRPAAPARDAAVHPSSVVR